MTWLAAVEKPRFRKPSAYAIRITSDVPAGFAVCDDYEATLNRDAVCITRTYLKTAAIGAMVLQCAVLAYIAMMPVDEAVFTTATFRYGAVAGIAAFVATVRIASHMAQAHITEMRLAQPGAGQNCRTHEAWTAALRLLSRANHCFTGEVVDGDSSFRPKA